MEMLMIGKQCFYGPPMHFHRMRTALAKAAGIPTVRLSVSSEEGDDIALEVPDLDGYGIVEKNLYGEWDDIPDDPILILLAHSDEEGVIKEEHMLPLVARMSQLKNAAHDLMVETHGPDAATTMYRNIDHFAHMLADAYAKEWPIEFRLEFVPE